MRELYELLYELLYEFDDELRRCDDTALRRCVMACVADAPKLLRMLPVVPGRDTVEDWRIGRLEETPTPPRLIDVAREEMRPVDDDTTPPRRLLADAYPGRPVAPDRSRPL